MFIYDMITTLTCLQKAQLARSAQINNHKYSRRRFLYAPTCSWLTRLSEDSFFLCIHFDRTASDLSAQTNIDQSKPGVQN